MSHMAYVRGTGSDGNDLVMQLIARGSIDDHLKTFAMNSIALDDRSAWARHRFYYMPASNTAVNHMILESQ